MSESGDILSRRSPRLGAREEESDDERLLNLFRNRAELKKAFADLQKALRLAEERLASQEAATRRAEERFQAIEQLLARPDTGYTALVYFQLRALWHACQERLQTLSAELRGRQEDRVRREELMRFNQGKQRQLAALDQQLAQAQDELEERRAKRNAARKALDDAHRFWAYFRRRKLAEALARREDEMGGARLRLAELQDRRAAVNAEPWPEFSGLGVKAKREINLRVIAAAQELYLHFSRDELARKARDANLNTVQEMRYGSESECKLLIGKVREAVATLGPSVPTAEAVEARARLIEQGAQYRSDRETVPMASSVARIELPALDPASGMRRRMPIEVNVLDEEYWNIYEALIP